ncbi:MAG: hypothetical protein RL755_57 [Pseudomonadota bacterium]|jgi:hypothetical protein
MSKQNTTLELIESFSYYATAADVNKVRQLQDVARVLYYENKNLLAELKTLRELNKTLLDEQDIGRCNLLDK